MDIISVLLIFLSINTFSMRVGPKEFQRRLLQSGSNAYLLDVRAPFEYKEGHLKGAHLLNAYDFSFMKDVLLISKKYDLYIYCFGAARSHSVYKYLKKHNYKNIVDMKGGIQEWKKLGLPIIKDVSKKTILEQILNY